MGKTWDMKRRILKLMESGRKTPSEISAALSIAPSTVTQHLKDLERMGAVRESNDEFVKKWRYFELNPGFNARMMENPEMMRMKAKSKLPYLAAAMVAAVFVIGAAALLASQPNAAAAQAAAIVPIRLTDPPTVPAGTNALLISYSSLQVHTKGQSNATGWISASGNGSVDLMSLINESEVIGSVKIGANTLVDMIRFNVTSARIVINGTAYNVTVPSGMVTAHIGGAGRVNSSANLLLDLSPSVVTIYTNTSTIFVLVPSVRAVVVPGNGSSASIGARVPLNVNERANIGEGSPNITVSSAGLAQIGNMTRFSITVRNNGNGSVQLDHIFVYGNESITVHPGQLAANARANSSTGAVSNSSANTSIGVNASSHISIADQERPQIGVSAGAAAGLGIGANGSKAGLNATAAAEQEREYGYPGIRIDVNGTAFGINSILGTPLSGSESVKELLGVGGDVSSLRVLNFQITQGGQLLLPFSGRCGGGTQEAAGVAMPCPAATDTEIHSQIGSGYTLAAGSSATFSFNGTIGMAFGHITVSPVAGDNYTIVVRGEEGAAASVNVTASS